MKLLLIISAVLEGAVGLALLVIPTVVVSLLLGAPLDTPFGLVVARIAGAALVALAITCWQARNGERGSPATGVVQAMLFYDFAAAMVRLRRHSFGPALHCFGRRSFCILLGMVPSNLWFTRRKLSSS